MNNVLPLQTVPLDTLRQTVLPSATESLPLQLHGVAKGFRLQTLPNPTADLTNAMEELTALFEERSVKRLAQRRLTLDDPTSLRGYDAIARAIRQFPDLPSAEAFSRLVAQLKAQPPTTARALLEQLSAFCKEPALQALLLQALRTLPSEAAAPKGLPVAEAEALLRQTKGAEMRAGVNLAEWVKAHASHPEALQAWRDLYANEVLGFTTPQACFRSLCANRGVEGLKEAITFLVKGCGIELQSVQPSLHPEVLRRILLDLQCVAVLRTVIERLDQLLARIQEQFGERAALSGSELTAKLVQLTEKSSVSEAEMEAIDRACGWHQRAVQIDFGRAWVALLRQLSERLFKQESGRTRLIEAAEAWLEQLIIEEEEQWS